MKELEKKKADALRKDITKKCMVFVKELLELCRENEVHPIIIAEVMNVVTEGVVVSIMASERGMNDKEFLKLLKDKDDEPDKRLGITKLLEAIMKKEKEDNEIPYRS